MSQSNKTRMSDQTFVRLKAGRGLSYQEQAEVVAEIERLRATMSAEAMGVIEAARQMPRATPAPGTASTEHNFKIAAGIVWDLDYALKRYDAAVAREKDKVDA